MIVAEFQTIKNTANFMDIRNWLDLKVFSGFDI